MAAGERTAKTLGLAKTLLKIISNSIGNLGKKGKSRELERQN
ncbi:MAG: hypothetical protein NZ901_09815 [Geminocystis sp.]|nr:hypothetical protein [Geminocystis sp.]MCS7148470.1 hypothetical protein [Geminocystis sp.]MCX8079426.1 hypothetical protein [Geminocystis sp.]MDW8114956.1 hypothetical protein [Geminocystis sp.]MDW8464222.1 hypothetical protein [Geminocystis sp.]